MNTMKEISESTFEIGDYIYFIDGDEICKFKISLVSSWVGEINKAQSGYDITYSNIHGKEVNHEHVFKSIQDLAQYHESILNTSCEEVNE